MTTEETAVQVRMVNVVFACADVATLAQFWCAVTSFQPKEGEPPWHEPDWNDAGWVALRDPKVWLIPRATSSAWFGR
jgi:hypothetical protein